jgi:hypothetical protein
MQFPLGDLTSANARDHDTRFYRAVAAITHLTPRAAKRRITMASGNMLLRNLFRKEWPPVDDIGDLTVARATDLKLEEAIAMATQRSVGDVVESLGAARGNTLVKTVFGPEWPTHPRYTDKEDDEDDEDDEGNEGDEDGEDNEGEDDEEESTVNPWVTKVLGNIEAAARRIERSRPKRVLRDRYELIAELGEGGFGTAFAARDQWVPDTLFVIKLARDVTGAVESLRREYSHLWSLQHPNIVPIQWLDQDTDTGDFFLVIRYGGLSVESIIESYGRFDLEFAISVLSDAALGLHHAHVCGVIHHDVSPGNILIDEKGVARVTDFGVSAMGRYATIATSKRTIIGTGLGFKQSYAAPEMHKGTAVTRKADQYSLALSFCAMLEGKGLSPRYQPRGFGRLSSRQNRALRQALSESADDRFPTIVDFAEALAK